MDTQTKGILQDTLNALSTSSEQVFVGSDGKDEVGLPIHDSRYIKRNCKRCYGRGVNTQVDLTKDVAAAVVENNDTRPGSRPSRRRALRAVKRAARLAPRHAHRHEITCMCVPRGYTRIRRELERRVYSELKAMGVERYDEKRQASMLQEGLKRHREQMGF